MTQYRRNIPYHIMVTSLCLDDSGVALTRVTPKARKAIGKLVRAFKHLRPGMVGDTLQGIMPNGDALAGSILAEAMIRALVAVRSERNAELSEVL